MSEDTVTRESVLTGYCASLNPNPILINTHPATKEDLVNELDYALRGEDKSYSFSQLNITHLCGIRDFRKLVPSFTYVNKKNKSSERFIREEIEKLLLDDDRINSLLEVANTEKYLRKSNIKLFKELYNYEKTYWNGKYAICFEEGSLFRQFVVDNGPRHYVSDDTWLCIFGDTVNFESCTIGYIYTADEIEVALSNKDVWEIPVDLSKQ
jgi:hypothetical protein